MYQTRLCFGSEIWYNSSNANNTTERTALKATLVSSSGSAMNTARKDNENSSTAVISPILMDGSVCVPSREAMTTPRKRKQNESVPCTV